MKKITLLCTLLAFVCTVHAQSKKDILLTINKKPVYKQEFLRVYNKNLDLVKDDSQKTVDGYIDLFVDYKIKVEEAYAQGLDKDADYLKEYKKYRAQLSRNYLFEEKIEEDMAREAYQRMQQEVSADHILIKVGYDALPQDTLQAYNKASEALLKAKAGEDFGSLVAQYSEEPNAKERKGKLGYFTAFSMVYPFETAAYNTPAGEFAPITRTSFGYHVIKVIDKRPMSKEITVSHIMVANKKDDPSFNAETRINEIYQLVQQGESFEALAKQFSDDKNSGKLGGKLRAFRKGKLRSPRFEDLALSLTTIGEISKPGQSSFGWHIVRLDAISKKKTFEEEKKQLLVRGNRGERRIKVGTEIRSKIKEKFGYKGNTEYTTFFNNFVSDAVLKKKWEYDTTDANLSTTLFTIGDTDFLYKDFAAYIYTRQKKPIPNSKGPKAAAIKYMFDEFETETLQNYFRDKLEEENPNYAAVINEYRDGLLIFELMQKNIWNKAKNDSTALQNYYHKNKTNYNWKDRVDASIFTSNEEAALIEVKSLLAAGKTPVEVKELLNTEEKVRVLLTKGVYEKGAKELPDTFAFNEGVSSIYNKESGYSLLVVNKVLPKEPKSFIDVKGKVMSKYQDQLEQEWMQELRAKHEVVIRKKTLKKIKKQLK